VRGKEFGGLCAIPGDERKLQLEAAVGAAQQSDQPDVAEHLRLVVRIRGAKRQPGGRLAFVIAGGHPAAERQRARVARPAAALHLHDEIVPVGALLRDEMRASSRVYGDLVDAGITAELDEAIDVAAEPAGERRGPRQPNERDLRLGKPGAERPQRGHRQQEIAQVQRTEDGDLTAGGRR
jgi:hypothetical protein